MMVNVILGLGSNIYPKSKNLRDAVRMLSNHAKIIQVSSIYKSISLLRDSQDDYFNIVLSINTDLDPNTLLKLIKSIEKTLGRADAEKWSSRIIDIDILDYNKEIIQLEDLSIPHSEMHKRSFVLYPLKEIVPNYLHPVFQKSVDTLLNELNDDLDIKRLGELHWL